MSEKTRLKEMNGFSENVRDVLEQMKFEDQIATMEKGGVLYQVISDFNSAKADMSPGKVATNDMGYIFENLADFSAIGNLFLLDSPNIIQVQCSRAYLAYKRVSKTLNCRFEHRTEGGGRKIARLVFSLCGAVRPESPVHRKRLIAAGVNCAPLK